jgi:hypothetical protein
MFTFVALVILFYGKEVSSWNDYVQSVIIAKNTIVLISVIFLQSSNGNSYIPSYSDIDYSDTMNPLANDYNDESIANMNLKKITYNNDQSYYSNSYSSL